MRRLPFIPWKNSARGAAIVAGAALLAWVVFVGLTDLLSPVGTARWPGGMTASSSREIEKEAPGLVSVGASSVLHLDRPTSVEMFSLVNMPLFRPVTVDYSDPVTGGAVPLIRVRGQERVMLSEHFAIGDFAASDGAPYARISMELVEALESLQVSLDVPVFVNSGYRHPRLNYDERIHGADESQHMAGLAADVWAPGKTPLEVATAALDALGCNVGLGLGAGFLHIDVRGHLASWSRQGAELDEVGFDMWVLERCAPDDADLMPAGPDSTKVVSGPDRIETYREEMAALARLMRRRQEPGVVLLDLRENVPGREAGIAYSLRYVDADHAVATSLDVQPLMERANASDNFVYVLVAPDGSQEVGIMSLNPHP